MLRRSIESFISTALLAAVVPFVIFSTVRDRLIFARRVKLRPQPARMPAPAATPAKGEFKPVTKPAKA